MTGRKVVPDNGEDHVLVEDTALRPSLTSEMAQAPSETEIAHAPTLMNPATAESSGSSGKGIRMSAVAARAGRRTMDVIQDEFGENAMLDVDEVLKMARRQYSMADDRRFLRMILCGMCVALTILITATFVVTSMAIQLAKDTEVRNQQMMTLSGETVQMALEDMVVLPDGTMSLRGKDSRRLAMCDGNKTCARRLQTELMNQPTPLATRDADLVPAELTSAMTQENLASLENVAIQMYDEGGELVKNIVKVTSFSRRILRSSKCGTVVDFQTTWGMLMLDDYDLHATETFLKFAAVQGLRHNLKGNGTRLQIAGHRRLNAAGKIIGFFKFVKQYDWKCDSVNKPLEKLRPPFSFAIRSLRACPDFSCRSMFPGNDPNKSFHLPGYQKDPHGNDDGYIAVTEDPQDKVLR